jgi:uncharacterized protein (DUF1501 family)
MDPFADRKLQLTRRALFGHAARGIGTAALAALLEPGAFARALGSDRGVLGAPHHRPTAKRVIYLCMSGGPSQLDLWDPKPVMQRWFDTDLPDSVRMGQRITTMTSTQTRFPIAPSRYSFAQHGASGTWVSELLPRTAGVVDRLAVVRSMHTEAINHDPGITFLQTGSEQPGRPSFGSWVSYGLGSTNADLPTFVVLHSSWSGKRDAQALYSRLWGSGFLPSRYQGVALRSSGDPVLYLSDPPGLDPTDRRRMLDARADLDREHYSEVLDPEIQTRIEQYEMAFRMQTSVPELTDISGEPEHVMELYGNDVRKPGTFAANCLLARRMAERGVRFIQIYQRDWDHHFELPRDLPLQCGDVDQGCAALILDLEQRGLLDDTLVVWGGEFGRTAYCQGTLSATNYGRDHHPRCFTMWLAGGGIRGGTSWGETDEFSYNIVKDPVHVHDLNATILHCLGIDHERLTFRHQGRDYRLTDVSGEVVTGLLT